MFFFFVTIFIMLYFILFYFIFLFQYVASWLQRTEWSSFLSLLMESWNNYSTGNTMLFGVMDARVKKKSQQSKVDSKQRFNYYLHGMVNWCFYTEEYILLQSHLLFLRPKKNWQNRGVNNSKVFVRKLLTIMLSLLLSGIEITLKVIFYFKTQ